MKRFCCHLFEHADHSAFARFPFLGTVGKQLFADNVGDMTLATPRLAPVLDIAWGAVLTEVAAAIGGLLADWILAKV
jgi:uncharacterized membrane protein